MSSITIQLLLTAATAGFSVVPVIADFNNTHATNPLWDPHARFHVVWQVASYIGVALLNLYLIWSEPLNTEKLLVAGGLAASMYAGFFVAVATKHRYGGALYNDNGYPPFKIRLARKELSFEPNITVFSALVIVVLAPAILLLVSSGI